MREFLRFFGVTLGGVLIDLAIAYTLATAFGVPLWLAASIGFAVAASVNYVIHQTWSFQGGSRSLSHRRALKYAAATAATLAARVGVVALLDNMLPDGLALPILIGGAGASFLVHFALSKFYVFAEPSPGADLS